MFTQIILRKLRNQCKTWNIFGQPTKEANPSQFRQIITFRSTAKIEANFKISSLKKIDATYNSASRQKRPQAWSSQFQLMYFSRKVEIDRYLLYLVQPTQHHVTIRTSPDLFKINNKWSTKWRNPKNINFITICK